MVPVVEQVRYSAYVKDISTRVTIMSIIVLILSQYMKVIILVK